MKATINTEGGQKPGRSSYAKSKYAERRASEVRLNFWVDGETANQIDKLVADTGLDRQEWLRRAMQSAIQLQLLDAQMTAGAVKGGFSSSPRQEAPRRKKKPAR